MGGKGGNTETQGQGVHALSRIFVIQGHVFSPPLWWEPHDGLCCLQVVNQILKELSSAKRIRGEGVAQALEPLPRKCQALSSNPSTTKKNK
jgi:hypothetical protein